MWFRALLIIALVYFVARSLVRVLHPRDVPRQVKGKPSQIGSRIDASRIQDASFKDIPDK